MKYTLTGNQSELSTDHTDRTCHAQDFRGLTVGPWVQELGWHAKGIVALAGCIVTALLGIATIIWYSMGGLDDDEVEREVSQAIRKKDAKKEARAAGVKSLFRRAA